MKHVVWEQKKATQQETVP